MTDEIQTLAIMAAIIYATGGYNFDGAAKAAHELAGEVEITVEEYNAEMGISHPSG